MFLKDYFSVPTFKIVVSQMFLKIQRMSEPQSLAALFCKELYLTSPLTAILANQFTKELNFRRFEKTRNGGIISDVLHCSRKFPIFFKI